MAHSDIRYSILIEINLWKGSLNVMICTSFIYIVRLFVFQLLVLILIHVQWEICHHELRHLISIDNKLAMVEIKCLMIRCQMDEKLFAMCSLESNSAWPHIIHTIREIKSLIVHFQKEPTSTYITNSPSKKWFENLEPRND